MYSNNVKSHQDDSASAATQVASNRSENGKFDSFSETRQLTILAVTMFVCFGVHNLLQEAIINTDGFHFGIILAYMEVFGVTVCSYIERRFVRKESGRVAPLKAYPLLTLCLMSSTAFATMSLNYINFPTKVVFRSCKLLPTMLIATIMNKKVYSLVEYLCALCVCAGLIVFAVADWKLTPSFNPIGLLLLSISVIADAILPNAQEKLFSYGASRLEVAVYADFFTLVTMTVSTVASGSLISALRLAATNQQLAVSMIVYTFISYIGVSSLMAIVKRFGAVVAVFLATARKGMTLVLSFLFFPKAFSWYYVMGAFLVLGSMLVLSLSKQYNKQRGWNDEPRIENEQKQLLGNINGVGSRRQIHIPMVCAKV